ncbi:hypothetical protein [Edaphobacter aggregans]|uniref:hypothetical protein n=1 Tax=Edaphobacter aggregans TaxID=570835 RepID=UPI00055005B2|nr:hypothetical protein [Edaphobacter aggregans]
MDTLDREFRAWESLIQRKALRPKRQPDGLLEIRLVGSAAELLSADELQERWAQLYVKEEFKRLGFSKVDGPFSRGPDYRVFQRRRWVFAEVETQWINYFRHGHHVNPAFDAVEYLILLSAEAPAPQERRGLPPQIVHIDREHFLTRFEAASAPQAKGHRDTIRIALVAGAMQQHWTTICSDANREMVTCPDCDSCAYFGAGMFGEAAPFFQELAARFIVAHALTDTVEADLTKIKSALLQKFVEQNPPD